jgi:malonyl-CoA decarboxylase
MAGSALARLVDGFSRQGGAFLRKYAPRAFRRSSAEQANSEMLDGLARDLLSVRGEASGIAIAADFLALYERMPIEERIAFFKLLASTFNPDPDQLEAALQRYREQGPAALTELSEAVESPRQELFRRLNLAPGGTAALVRMRSDLLANLRQVPNGRLVDRDLFHLMEEWFNRGFLHMQEISWSSPASLLERVIRYEAVHHIGDWTELRNRLDPSDRRCFAFFHPAMPDEPLIFVEVALSREIPSSIQGVLQPARIPLEAEDADTAVFYSISNCQPGLRGISFGHFLIKQVATDLKRDLPNLKQFVTLSPIPDFMKWLAEAEPELAGHLADGSWAEKAGSYRDVLQRHAVAYFTEARNKEGRPVDSVARFHLGNGARLERLNWLADTSGNGMRQSAGMMVNYFYDLPAIEECHEAYANQGRITLGEPFKELMQSQRSRKQAKRA